MEKQFAAYSNAIAWDSEEQIILLIDFNFSFLALLFANLFLV